MFIKNQRIALKLHQMLYKTKIICLQIKQNELLLLALSFPTRLMIHRMNLPPLQKFHEALLTPYLKESFKYLLYFLKNEKQVAKTMASSLNQNIHKDLPSEHERETLLDQIINNLRMKMMNIEKLTKQQIQSLVFSSQRMIMGLIILGHIHIYQILIKTIFPVFLKIIKREIGFHSSQRQLGKKIWHFCKETLVILALWFPQSFYQPQKPSWFKKTLSANHIECPFIVYYTNQKIQEYEQILKKISVFGGSQECLQCLYYLDKQENQSENEKISIMINNQEQVVNSYNQSNYRVSQLYLNSIKLLPSSQNQNNTRNKNLYKENKRCMSSSLSKLIKQHRKSRTDNKKQESPAVKQNQFPRDNSQRPIESVEQQYYTKQVKTKNQKQPHQKFLAKLKSLKKRNNFSLSPQRALQQNFGMQGQHYKRNNIKRINQNTIKTKKNSDLISKLRNRNKKFNENQSYKATISSNQNNAMIDKLLQGKQQDMIKKQSQYYQQNIVQINQNKNSYYSETLLHYGDQITNKKQLTGSQKKANFIYKSAFDCINYQDNMLKISREAFKKQCIKLYKKKIYGQSDKWALDIKCNIRNKYYLKIEYELTNHDNITDIEILQSKNQKIGFNKNSQIIQYLLKNQMHPIQMRIGQYQVLLPITLIDTLNPIDNKLVQGYLTRKQVSFCKINKELTSFKEIAKSLRLHQSPNNAKVYERLYQFYDNIIKINISLTETQPEQSDKIQIEIEYRRDKHRTVMLLNQIINSLSRSKQAHKNIRPSTKKQLPSY